MKALKLATLVWLVSLGSASAQSNISVNIDGKTYQCSEGGNNGDAAIQKKMTFYNTDFCTESKGTYTTFSLSSVQVCERLVNLEGNYSVWSIKYEGGDCQDIRDTNFLTLCTSMLVK